MANLTKAEILKTSAGIVAAMIKLRTPPLSELEDAYKAFGSVVQTSKSLNPGDAVTPDIATGVNAVIERMESFRSGYCSNDPSQKKVDKSFTLPEFTSYLQAEIAASNAETNSAKALKRLHVLAGQIESASAVGGAVPGLNKAGSMEDTSAITLPVFVDPAQIVPTDSTSPITSAQTGAPAGDSAEFSAQGGSAAVAGNASNGSIVAQSTGTPGSSNYDASKSATPLVSASDALAAAAAVVESATVAKSEQTFDGWPLDLNAPRRKSSVHFGKDPVRPRA